jgi:hypothetical protein
MPNHCDDLRQCHDLRLGPCGKRSQG